MECQECNISTTAHFKCFDCDILVCKTHIGQHLAQKHKINTLFEILEQGQKSILDQKLNTWIKYLKTLKRKVYHETEQVISIIRYYSNSLTLGIENHLNCYKGLLKIFEYQEYQMKQIEFILSFEMVINPLNVNDLQEITKQKYSEQLIFYTTNPSEVSSSCIEKSYGLITENENLKKKLDEKIQILNKREQEYQDLQNNFEQKTQELSKKKSELDIIKIHMNEKLDIINKRENEIQNLRMKLFSKNQEFDRNQKELQTLTKNYTEKVQELAITENENGILKNQIIEKTQEFTKKENELMNFQNQLKAKIQELSNKEKELKNQLLVKNDEFSKKLRDLYSVNKQLGDMIQYFKNLRKEDENNINKVKDTIITKQKTIDPVENQPQGIENKSIKVAFNAEVHKNSGLKEKDAKNESLSTNTIMIKNLERENKILKDILEEEQLKNYDLVKENEIIKEYLKENLSDINGAEKIKILEDVYQKLQNRLLEENNSLKKDLANAIDNKFKLELQLEKESENYKNLDIRFTSELKQMDTLRKQLILLNIMFNKFSNKINFHRVEKCILIKKIAKLTEMNSELEKFLNESTEIVFACEKKEKEYEIKINNLEAKLKRTLGDAEPKLDNSKKVTYQEGRIISKIPNNRNQPLNLIKKE